MTKVDEQEQMGIFEFLMCSQGIKIFEEMVEYGVDLNERDCNNSGWSFLHFAAIRNDVDIARFLIENGVNMNAECNDRETPLALAIATGSTKVAKLLIDKGAEVNVMDKYHRTPLFLAVLVNNFEIVELLINKGADVNVRGPDGYTPLHAAIHNGYREIAKLLIFKGADVNASSYSCSAPLSKAVWNNLIDIAELLIENSLLGNIFQILYICLLKILKRYNYYEDNHQHARRKCKQICKQHFLMGEKN